MQLASPAPFPKSYSSSPFPPPPAASEVVLRLCCLIGGGVLLYHRLLSDLLVLLSSGGSLLGLVAAELLLGLGLDGLVGSLDGGSTLDGSGAEVRAVAVLGDLVGNSLVGPFEMKVSAVLRGFLRRISKTYLRLDLTAL